MVLADVPQKSREHEPGGKCHGQHRPRRRMGQEAPAEQCEQQAADRSHERAARVQGCRKPSAISGGDARAPFLVPLMLFEKRRARRENRGKGEEQSSEGRPPALRNKGRNNRDTAAQDEPRDVLVRPHAFQRREVALDDHQRSTAEYISNPLAPHPTNNSTATCAPPTQPTPNKATPPQTYAR